MVKIIHLPRVHNGILGLLTYFLQVIESNMSHKIKLFYNFSLCPLLVFTQLFTLAEKECSEIKSSGKEPYLVCIAFLKKNKKIISVSVWFFELCSFRVCILQVVKSLTKNSVKRCNCVSTVKCSSSQYIVELILFL